MKRRRLRVLAVGRDAARGEGVARAMAAAGTPGVFLRADLLSIKDIQRLAGEILALTSTIDVLFNNAGGVFPPRSVSGDGIEATLALNAVAPFALTRHLHGALARAKGRVVNTATGFLERTRLKVDTLVEPPKYFGLPRYSLVKLALIMLTVEQAERWKGDGISALSVQPGIVVGTRFGGGQPGRPSRLRSARIAMMGRMGIGATIEQAVERYTQCAFGDLPSGSYFAFGRVTPLPRQAQEADTRAAVWALVERLSKTVG